VSERSLHFSSGRRAHLVPKQNEVRTATANISASVERAADPEPPIRVLRIMVMLDPEQCRLAAEKCRREAARALNPIERERWLKMAAEWSDLARQAEQKRR